jgi:tetratricopeptide (TPR) repeat protein
MSIFQFFKQQAERDPLLRFLQKLTGRREYTPQEAAHWHFKKATSFVNYKSSKFDLRSALFHLKEALSIEPDNPYYHCEFGRILLMAPSSAVVCGDDGGLSLSRCAELAIESLEKSIKIEPNLSWAYYHLALANEYIGKREKAKEICRTAIKKFNKLEAKSFMENYLKRLESPRPDKETVQKLEQESLQHLKQALMYQRAGEKKRAIQEFEEGCNLAPDSAWLYTTLRQLSSKKSNV